MKHSFPARFSNPVRQSSAHSHMRALTLAFTLLVSAFGSAAPQRQASAAQFAAPDAAASAGLVAPAITMTKASSMTEAAVGDTVTYTVTVKNTDTQTVTMVMTDVLPAELSYVTDSLNPSTGQANYDTPNRMIEWSLTLAAGGEQAIAYQTQATPPNNQPDCGKDITNTAQARIFDAFQNEFAADASHTLKWICPDLGDAPDSTTHNVAAGMTAYPGPIGANFPTVFDPATGAPPGPRHAFPKQDAWLGTDATVERDADQLFDADGIANLNTASDSADHDGGDDGVLRWPPLDDCKPVNMAVRVTITGGEKPRYLNAWFDWNRDGDWKDLPTQCANAAEWAVRNYTVTLGNGSHVITTPTFVPVDFTTPNGRTLWARVTLAEMPAPVDAQIARSDGRGPEQGYRFGETEDYLVALEQPSNLIITKTVDLAQIQQGGTLEYAVTITNTGGSPASGVSMADPIPPLMTYLAGSVSSTSPTASYNAVLKRIEWTGTLAAGGSVTIRFKTVVSRDAKCDATLANVARIINDGVGLGRVAAVATTVICPPAQTPPGLSLVKRVRNGAGEQVLSTEFVPGAGAQYVLTLSSTDSLTHAVRITDALPAGLVAVAKSSTTGMIDAIDDGRVVVWAGLVSPSTPVVIVITVRAQTEFECGKDIVNTAQWSVPGYSGVSNPATLALACSDLGDAPDSSNHASTAMTAYPSIAAAYPTVFDGVASQRGPRHIWPQPFHLGRDVTAEFEADLGFDADGVNNLRPAKDQADLDKADDGVVRASLNWRDCRPTKFEVVVTIAPGMAARLSNGTGYLNVWLDSNRDGDWADASACAGSNAAALEHIVIDQPINVAALGAGVHTIIVNTTSPVSWPASLAAQRVWMRTTLSEKPANKPLTSGSVSHGDGRGFDTAFSFGETEDDLLPGETAVPSSDASVTKRGEIWPDFDPATQERRWVIGWLVNYANAGPAAASAVHVLDTFSADQALLAEHSIPLLPHTQSGNTLDYTAGALPAGGSGLVIVRTAISWTATPGTVFTNTAVVNSGNDGNAVNNTSVATVTVPILPPMITGPFAGSTCSTTVAVTGVAQPGVSVDLYVDGALHSTLATDGSGNWATSLTLAAGSHNLHAVARLGGMSSDPSPTVTIIVDPTLFWDPISLRFVDDLGHTIIPSGRLDEAGWSVFLRPGHAYTVSVRTCCTDEGAAVTMNIGDITLTLTDPDGDHVFTATFGVPAEGRFTGTVRICVTCHLIRRCSDGQVTIDPEGTVYDASTGQPIASAQVVCMQENGSGSGAFSSWDAAAYDQINPQIVGADGYFSFFTPPGTYRLNVTKAGYQPFESPDLLVVDAPVHYDVPLTPLVTKSAHVRITMSSQGFSPAVVRIPVGGVVEWINGAPGARAASSTTTPVSAQSAGSTTVSWSSGMMMTGESYKRQFDTVGTYTYFDPSNPQFSAIVIVERTVYLPLVSR